MSSMSRQLISAGALPQKSGGERADVADGQDGPESGGEDEVDGDREQQCELNLHDLDAGRSTRRGDESDMSRS